MASEDELSPDQIEFTNAFNRQRPTLAGFAHCHSQDELDIVRDALYLGLAHDILPETIYGPLACYIFTDSKVAPSVAETSTEGMATVIASARSFDKWDDLVRAVKDKALAVGSDLEGIWRTLETGRLEWLRAVDGACSVRDLLRGALEKDGALDSPGDVSDAKMVWIYGLSLNVPELCGSAAVWSSVVQMSRPAQPLVGYDAALWDPRSEDWRPLDMGVQAAVERGGSNLEDVWNA